MSNINYDEVGEQLLAMVEAGRPPWQQNWQAGAGGGMPVNASTGKSYRGSNAMNLWAAAMVAGWAELRFVTRQQALKLGGCVREDEKGNPVFFFLGLTKVDGKLYSPDHPAVKAGYPNSVPSTATHSMMKNYIVFNVAQVDGLAVKPAPEPTPLEQRHEAAYAVLKRCEGEVRTVFGDAQTPFYMPALDQVRMPARDRFETHEGCLAALAHEYSHASGAAKRLNRPGITNNGWDRDRTQYAIEELVAESSAAFVMAALGLGYQSQHADYLASWCQQLREQYPKPGYVLMRAFGQAQKAADCVLAGLPAIATELAEELAPVLA